MLRHDEATDKSILAASKYAAKADTLSNGLDCIVANGVVYWLGQNCRGRWGPYNDYLCLKQQ